MPENNFQRTPLLRGLWNYFSNNRRKVLKIALIILVLAIVPITIIELKNVQDKRSRASSDQPVFSFSPDNQTHGKGLLFPVDIYIDTASQEVDLVDITFSFNPNTLRLDKFISTKDLDTQLSSNNIISSDQGHFRYQSLDTLGQPLKGRVQIGTLYFTAVKGGQGLLKIDKAEIGNNDTLVTITDPPMASITIIDPDESLSSTTPEEITSTPVPAVGITLSPTTRAVTPTSASVIPTTVKPTATSTTPTTNPSPTISPTQSQDSPLDKLLKSTFGKASPTPSVCPKKKLGDSNCDGKIDQPDILIWKEELDSPGALSSDFNDDKKIDLLDYLIWRRNAL